MMIRKRAVCIAIAAVVIIAAVSPLVARPLDDVVASGKLRIALYEDNKPFSWTDDAGKPVGIDVEIGAALSEELGVEPEYLMRMPGEEVDDDLRQRLERAANRRRHR